jgi:tRNA-dihydrouridine synthase
VRAAGFETPVVGAGGVNSFELAEGALRRGECDFVAAARQSLADPDWWRKLEEGRGADIRRCEFTNYCEGLDQQHKQVTCKLWDRELDAPMPWTSAGAAALPLSHDGKRRLIAPG